MAAPTNPFLGIEPKMYRHFAVITVALSTVVAVFANGDAQEAMAQSQRVAKHNAAETRAAKAKLTDKRSDKRRSGGGFSGPYGAPMDGGGGGDSSYIPAGMVVTPAPILIEVDQKALARMTPAQRAAYLRKLEEERQKRMAQGPILPTQQQISALAEQSAARSGSDSID
ncbi:hypothetical protein [Novosphingobium taihuense]|uniref:Uncharacterized protein n=1 Tax=Novosphingobium taihuense TaxID=260085 RepID=A0A7W7EUF5_9SPHN|nr:hypothetical protein [Novosphingobium taihuense]MBB4613861.1 hypothetical protein [Novosphingobium taihuense]TWH83368.1 hypothetical protein IQ25_03024 [Novosphingobium taihuense]